MIEIDNMDWNLIQQQLLTRIVMPSLTELINNQMMSGMRIAGGDITSVQSAQIQAIETQLDHNRLISSLMPGHCIVERRDLMIQAMKQGKDGIDSILEYISVNHHCEVDEDEAIEWISERKILGWIVPIATGYQGISEIAPAENQRDPETPHCFAESLVTLGQFIMPYRIENLDQMLWHYHFDKRQHLYLCQPNQSFQQVA